MLTFTHTNGAWYGNESLPRGVRDEIILNQTDSDGVEVGGDVLLRWYANAPAMRVEAYPDAFTVLGYFMPILQRIGADARPIDVINLLLQHSVLDATERESVGAC